jgi:hypothetical protein
MKDLDALWEEVYTAYKTRQAELKLKADNPYVADLIEILRPHKDVGLHRSQITRSLQQIRAGKGLQVAEALDKAVQSSLQRHAKGYAGFRKRNAPDTDDLFYASQGMGSGYWAVRLDKATAWLIAKNKLPVT